MSSDTQVPPANKVSENSRRHFRYRSNTCLNCGHPLDLSDVYCPYCSQLNSTKQLSLKDFFSEFFNSIVSYDSRLRYTISDLLFRPGTITRRYVTGERLRYANPFRFFLSVSIIYFLLNGIINTFVATDSENAIVKTNDEVDPGIKYSIGDKTFNLNESNQYQGNNEVPITTLDSVNKKVDSILKNTTGDNKVKKEQFELISEKELDTLGWAESKIKRFIFYQEFYEETKITDVAIALDSLNHSHTRMNRWIYQKGQVYERIRDKPTEFLNYMLGKVPFFLFFFTPVFAIFFWLIYSRKKYSYVEHMVFIFHIFSFLFIGMFIALIPDLLIGEEILSGILFTLIGPFYFYKALRNFYKQNRFVTILKFLFLNIVFFMSSIFAAAIFFVITAAVY